MFLRAWPCGIPAERVAISDVQAIDHNLYVKGDRAYLTNYVSGLRVLDATSLETSTRGDERELAFFDTSPEFSGVRFNGAWSNYPFRCGML